MIVDHVSHPHVHSSLSLTWDRETKTKAQGLQASLCSNLNPELHYRVNVAIPFIDHLLEEMS